MVTLVVKGLKTRRAIEDEIMLAGSMGVRAVDMSSPPEARTGAMYVAFAEDSHL
jgi:hypothetical protein